jgi:hypothetical protein
MLGAGLDLFRFADGSISMSPADVAGGLVVADHLLSVCLRDVGCYFEIESCFLYDETDGLPTRIDVGEGYWNGFGDIHYSFPSVREHRIMIQCVPGYLADGPSTNTRARCYRHILDCRTMHGNVEYAMWAMIRKMAAPLDQSGGVTDLLFGKATVSLAVAGPPCNIGLAREQVRIWVGYLICGSSVLSICCRVFRVIPGRWAYNLTLAKFLRATMY